jgi:hypothetical protein
MEELRALMFRMIGISVRMLYCLLVLSSRTDRVKIDTNKEEQQSLQGPDRKRQKRIKGRDRKVQKQGRMEPT